MPIYFFIIIIITRSTGMDTQHEQTTMARHCQEIFLEKLLSN